MILLKTRVNISAKSQKFANLWLFFSFISGLFHKATFAHCVTQLILFTLIFFHESIYYNAGLYFRLQDNCINIISGLNIEWGLHGENHAARAAGLKTPLVSGQWPATPGSGVAKAPCRGVSIHGSRYRVLEETLTGSDCNGLHVGSPGLVLFRIIYLRLLSSGQS